MRLLLKPNGCVLEQLLSPLVVATTPAHDELRRLGRGCVTKHHVRHYKGFAMSQWDLFRKESPPRVKPLLYVFRVLLAGIHLLRTGDVEANLGTLNEEFRLPWIGDLIAQARGLRARAADDDRARDVRSGVPATARRAPGGGRDFSASGGAVREG